MVTQQVQQGWSQMTAAAQSIIRQGLGSAVRSVSRRTTSRRRAKRSVGAAGKKRKRRASSSSKRTRSSGSRLKKGSAAAKAYMAKIRKLRK